MGNYDYLQSRIISLGKEKVGRPGCFKQLLGFTTTTASPQFCKLSLFKYIYLFYFSLLLPLLREKIHFKIYYSSLVITLPTYFQWLQWVIKKPHCCHHRSSAGFVPLCHWTKKRKKFYFLFFERVLTYGVYSWWALFIIRPRH